jgi:hypothetical protein
LREAWVSESATFTPWLAQPDNLSILSETLEMDLALVGTESSVGSFRADIVCRDAASDNADDHLVLVENQLERTDHTHLGQLLTYAAGLQTVTIVWIAGQFSEPHRAALDWLNEITDERFRFFGLEVELWQIGDSALAPKFNIVSKPNSWSKAVSQERANRGSTELSSTRQAQLAFWGELSARLNGSGSALKGRTPRAQHWYSLAIGRSGYNLNALFVVQKRKIGVEMYFSGQSAHQSFEFVQQDQADLETILGPLDWIKAAKEARIVQYREARDILDENSWPDALDWITNRLEAFDNAFRERVRKLPD